MMDSHINSRPISPSRTVAIARYEKEKIGVCIYLSADQLRDLGIEPAETEMISYQVVQFDESCMLTFQSVSETTSPEATVSTTD